MATLCQCTTRHNWNIQLLATRLENVHVMDLWVAFVGVVAGLLSCRTFGQFWVCFWVVSRFGRDSQSGASLLSRSRKDADLAVVSMRIGTVLHELQCQLEISISLHIDVSVLTQVSSRAFCFSIVVASTSGVLHCNDFSLSARCVQVMRVYYYFALKYFKNNMNHRIDFVLDSTGSFARLKSLTDSLESFGITC